MNAKSAYTGSDWSKVDAHVILPKAARYCCLSGIVRKWWSISALQAVVVKPEWMTR